MGVQLPTLERSKNGFELFFTRFSHFFKRKF